ncbi:MULTISPECIES: TetR/AcrR family transcriptional regulator [Bacillales]|uniref:Helix-turn-helix domain-containing protein n=1 Tax=Lysinibacillus louembei TaxID=1470088 RepID=A0ABZ0S0Z8_9BACI|nr:MULTISPECIES: TetR/AcrR family transcriptional regulator [Bacillales]MCT6924767.1 TetR/AcrR family transcriptional regulator [Metasolibacillus sp.]MCT6941035.1 TetR/AcrR family transcriptional regulator [Metasolibacillus sp.]WPK13252.1 helix-turn-helix domain-containing protein [Lysinibacillus louembei]
MGERGRPKGASGEESRALLLEVAAREFAQNGYHETKVSAIVKGASLSQPTFYLYFKNKEAIFEELESLFHTRLMAFIKQSRLQPELEFITVKARVTHNLKEILAFLDKNPYLTRIGFYLSAKADAIKAQIVEQIRDNLDYEVRAGYFRKDIDTSMVAESLVGIIERLTFTKILTKQKRPEEIANDIADLLLEGIRNREG